MSDPMLERSAEARGPHLPDALLGIPVMARLFILLAVARFIWFVLEADLGPAPALSTLASFVAAIIPSVVAILLPAALLVRHPDAPSRARTLFLGTVLFAVVEGLRALGTLLQPVFERLTPGSEETPVLVPLALVYGALGGLLLAFAVAKVGLGLAGARRIEDVPGMRRLELGLVVTVILIAVARVVSVSQLPLDQIAITPTVILYQVSAVVLGVASIAAWGFLTATAVRGARAGETPERGWSMGARGTVLVIAAFGLVAVLTVFRPTAESQPFWSTLGLLASTLHALGYMGLLTGLLLGMPSLDDPDHDPAAEGTDDDDPASEGPAAPPQLG